MFWLPSVSSAGFRFFIVRPRFSLFFLMLRERKAIAATASMHITLQIPLRTVLWQQLGDIWPHGDNTKEKWPADIGTRTRNPRFACPNASHWTTYRLPKMIRRIKIESTDIFRNFCPTCLKYCMFFLLSFTRSAGWLNGGLKWSASAL